MSGLSFRRRVGLVAVGALLLALVLPVTAASAATSSTAVPNQRSETVTVPANQEWVPTGVDVSPGSLLFRASGTINVQSGNPAFNETPAGDGVADPSCIASSDTPWGDDWLAEGFPCWSLIGKIGANGQPFEIGDSNHYTVSSPDQLYLSVDDQIGYFGDNSGSWTVVITFTVTANRTCVYSLTPYDAAPGNWWTEHKKFLFAYGTSQDLTALFSSGRLIISYSDQNYDVLGTFNRNSYWIGVQSKNQWGLRTRWTWFNPNFTKYHWLALWQCLP